MYSGTDGCILCLSPNNTQFKDIQGRPIVVLIGMVYGTFDEMHLQINHAINSAENSSSGICYVFETNHPSFRFPEKNIRKIMKDINSCKHAEHSVIHVVGLSRFYKFWFKFAMKFIKLDVKQRLIVHDDLSSLSTHIPPHFLLTRWKGQVAFDIDAFVTEKCALENCERSSRRRTMSKELSDASKLEIMKFYNSRTG